MARNVKRFLVASLLSLAPSITLAEPVGFDFAFQRQGIQVPSRQGAPALLPSSVQDYLVFNMQFSPVYMGYFGTDTPYPFAPYPVPYYNWGGFRVFPIAPTVQTFYWTTNPADPAAGPTCVWQLAYDITNGVCTALLSQATYGGASCYFDASQSFVDSGTCNAQIATYFQ